MTEYNMNVKITSMAIESKDKKDYFSCQFEPEKMKLSYEYYGQGSDSFDVETLYTIPKSEYSKIAKKFGKNSEDDIVKVLRYIEETDQVAELKKYIQSGAIEIADKFSWWSPND